MIRSGYRRMTEEEGYIAGKIAYVGFMAPEGCPTGCIVGAVMFIAVFSVTWVIQWFVGWWLGAEAPPGWSVYTAAGVGSIGFMGALLQYLVRISKKSMRPDDARIDLVEVIHCQATDAVKLEYPDHEWDGYFVKLDKGIAIYLQNMLVNAMSYDASMGPHDKRTDEERELDGAFPNRKFTIVRTAAEPRIVLSIECKGERFSPLLRIPVKEMVWENEYRDGEIFHENWGDLIAKINARKPNPKSEPKPETSEGDSSP